jgi:hypothetical protein
LVGGVGVYWLREVYESQERDLSGAPDPDHPDVARHTTDAFVGGNVGFGIETRRLLGPLGFGIQGRWHCFFEPSVDRLDRSGFPRFYAVSVMVSVG